MNRDRYSSIHEAPLEPVGDVFPSPADWRDQFIYFLLVDRFDDNRRYPPYEPEKTPRDRDPAGGETYQGGNIRGITRRLDYIKDLGATTIWISPIFKNRLEDEHGYHGYGIQDFLDVDPRFGSKEDLRGLVREAHKRGLYVILDIIINHTGNNWAYKDDAEPEYKRDGGQYEFGFWREHNPGPGLGPDDAVWPLEFQNPDWYRRRGRIGNWDEPDETVHGDFFGFKELDLQNNEVLDTLAKVFSYWIADTDIDGYRLDTVKHISSEATAAFSSRIREFAQRIGKQNFFLFGEVVGTDEVIKQYVVPNVSGEHKSTLDAALDFPLYFVLEEVIKGFTDPAILSAHYEKLDGLYPHLDVADYFVTFVDNHDQMARPWKRFLHGADARQAILAIGYLLTSRGVPCIYYGTEQGFDGGNNSDKLIRECMFGGKWGAFGTTGAHFFDENHPVYASIKKIAEIRVSEPALRYGRQYFRDISRDGDNFYFPQKGDGILAYSRVLDSEEVVVVMNLFNNEQKLSILTDNALAEEGAQMHDALGAHEPVSIHQKDNRARIEVSLTPLQMCIFKRKA